MRSILLLLLAVACAAPPASDSGSLRGQPSRCVVLDGELRIIPVTVHPVRGELTADGQPLSRVSPDSVYAAGAEWFERKEPILIRGVPHIPYGGPRALSASVLTRVGDYRGVPLFASTDEPRWSGFIFVPLRRGCVFQAYEPPHRQE